MNPKEIELYSLIGLRALAEYDLPQYRRAVDMSKQQLERKIQSRLHMTQNPEIRQLYENMKDIIDSAENQVELSYMLQQIYTNSAILTHFYSMQHRQSHTDQAPYELSAEDVESGNYEVKNHVVTREDEFVRLSVMCLLRRLPGYSPVFNMLLKNVEVDCVLEARSSDLPHIIVEAKTHIPEGGAGRILKELHSVMSAYGRGTIGLVIVQQRVLVLNEQNLGKAVYVLVFDIRRNRFVGEDLDHFVRVIGGLGLQLGNKT